MSQKKKSQNTLKIIPLVDTYLLNNFYLMQVISVIDHCLTIAQDPEPLNLNNLQGTYCLTTVNNIQWYRAFIKNINEESIIVNMFDIGLLTDVCLKQVIDLLKLNIIIIFF